MTDATPSAYLRKAERALATARLLLQANDADGACNRAYYAMFDAAHAALFALGVEGVGAPIKTHNGLIAKFGQHLVSGNYLAAEHGEDFNAVQRLRQVADYSGDPVSMKDAVWAVERAQTFCCGDQDEPLDNRLRVPPSGAGRRAWHRLSVATAFCIDSSWASR